MRAPPVVDDPVALAGVLGCQSGGSNTSSICARPYRFVLPGTDFNVTAFELWWRWRDGISPVRIFLCPRWAGKHEHQSQD